MILGSETYSKPVFHVIGNGHYAGVLENFPFPTPVFEIKRLKTDDNPIWRFDVKYDIGFTEDMLQRSDVLEYVIQAQQFVDTTNITTIRDTVTRLLVHWSKLFPRGVPDVAF